MIHQLRLFLAAESKHQLALEIKEVALLGWHQGRARGPCLYLAQRRCRLRERKSVGCLWRRARRVIRRAAIGSSAGGGRGPATLRLGLLLISVSMLHKIVPCSIHQIQRCLLLRNDVPHFIASEAQLRRLRLLLIEQQLL